MEKEKSWLKQFKQDFYGKKVLILGLGVLGRGTADAKFFAEIGAKVKVTDLKTKQELEPSLEKLKEFSIQFVLGEHRTEDVLSADYIIRNPAVPRDSQYLQLARRNNIPIYMDEALFLKYAPVHTIGVTGTRGKSTTATLIYQVLEKADFSVWLAGNIRDKAALPLLTKIKRNDWVVMELSSWQLQGFGWEKISPNIAVFTNVFEDHLNRYPSMEEYIDDKKNIFRYQTENDFLVFYSFDKRLKKFVSDAKSQLIEFSKKSFPSKWNLNLKGKHNRLNAGAVFKVGEILKIDFSIMKKVFQNFKGLKYRLEKTASIDGVDYYNDTTSTTPAAGKAALNSFQQDIVLICGGASKNLDMHGFAEAIVKKVKKVVLLEGTETKNLKKLIKELGGAEKIIGEFQDFHDAVVKAGETAEEGDIVLLSPGCASFGMFVNEFDRGEQFDKIVKEMIND